MQSELRVDGQADVQRAVEANLTCPMWARGMQPVVISLVFQIQGTQQCPDVLTH